MRRSTSIALGYGLNIQKGKVAAYMVRHSPQSVLPVLIDQRINRRSLACREIPAQTLIEISPVLLFTSAEYEEHGKHTVLDHYTFVWRDGRMALALGLGMLFTSCADGVQPDVHAPGSLFNHSPKPNVSYTIDPSTESIRYVTSRKIMPDEELCIFYGHKLWFDPIDAMDGVNANPAEEQDDGWGGLAGVGHRDEEPLDDISAICDGFATGPPDVVVLEEELPFKRIRLTPDDEEEEDMDAVRKGGTSFRAPGGRHVLMRTQRKLGL